VAMSGSCMAGLQATGCRSGWWASSVSSPDEC
jgi:hypothetical protein